MDLIILVMGDPFQPDPGNRHLRPIFKRAGTFLRGMARRAYAAVRRGGDARPRAPFHAGPRHTPTSSWDTAHHPGGDSGCPAPPTDRRSEPPCPQEPRPTRGPTSSTST